MIVSELIQSFVLAESNVVSVFIDSFFNLVQLPLKDSPSRFDAGVEEIAANARYKVMSFDTKFSSYVVNALPIRSAVCGISKQSRDDVEHSHHTKEKLEQLIIFEKYHRCNNSFERGRWFV